MNQPATAQHGASSEYGEPAYLEAPARGSKACSETTRGWLLRGRPQPDATPIEVPITRSPFTVGRRSENSLCLSNATVSGRHAEFALTGRSVVLTDLGSTNGTYVNGNRLSGTQVLSDGDVLQFGTAIFEIRSKGDLPPSVTVTADVAASARAHQQFGRLLSDPAVLPFFQPIVRFQDRGCVGFEVLARSHLVGLESPAEMFRVATLQNAEQQLSALVRWRGVLEGRLLESELYLNTHPSEIGDPALVGSLEALREEFPEERIVLEIHEAAITSSVDLRDLRERLNDLKIGLAYDDFGAGQARLKELVEVPPDVIKFDMTLIRSLPTATIETHRLLSTLVAAVQQLNVAVLAEGVETEEEAGCCRELGFELGQGYYFGRPQPLDQEGQYRGEVS